MIAGAPPVGPDDNGEKEEVGKTPNMGDVVYEESDVGANSDECRSGRGKFRGC